VRQHVQQPLRLLVDPVQVLEDYYHWLAQTFAQNNPLDRVERTLTLDPRVHLSVRVGAVDYPQQSEQVREGVFQGRVERGERGARLVTPRRGIVCAFDTEIVMQQFQHWQPRRGLAVRDRIGFEYLARAGNRRLELVEQPRLAVPGFCDHRNNLPVPCHRLFQRVSHLLQFALTPDKPGESASRRQVEMRSQRPHTEHFINIQWLCNT